MKRILSVLNLLLLFFVFFIYFTPSALAAASLTVDQNPVIYGKPAKFMVAGCPANDPSVEVRWDNIYGIKFDERRVNASAQGTAELTEVLTEPVKPQAPVTPKQWSFHVTCGPAGQPEAVLSFDARAETPADSPLVMNVYPNPPFKNDPTTMVQVANCPKNSTVTFEIFRQDIGGNSPVNFTSGTAKADSNGVAEYRPGRPLDHLGGVINDLTQAAWIARATCGGNSADYRFNPEDVENPDPAAQDPASFPTEPQPPKPPCNEYAADGKCAKVDTAIGALCTDEKCFMESIFILLLSLSGGISVLVMIYAGYLYMVSRGNPEQLQRAREMIISAIVGLLFIVFSFIIMETITGDILRLPGFLFQQAGDPCLAVPKPPAC
jgi:hypothetical protein